MFGRLNHVVGDLPRVWCCLGGLGAVWHVLEFSGGFLQLWTSFWHAIGMCTLGPPAPLCTRLATSTNAWWNLTASRSFTHPLVRMNLVCAHVLPACPVNLICALLERSNPIEPHLGCHTGPNAELARTTPKAIFPPIVEILSLSFGPWQVIKRYTRIPNTQCNSAIETTIAKPETNEAKNKSNWGRNHVCYKKPRNLEMRKQNCNSEMQMQNLDPTWEGRGFK